MPIAIIKGRKFIFGEWVDLDYGGKDGETILWRSTDDLRVVITPLIAKDRCVRCKHYLEQNNRYAHANRGPEDVGFAYALFGVEFMPYDAERKKLGQYLHPKCYNGLWSPERWADKAKFYEISSSTIPTPLQRQSRK